MTKLKGIRKALIGIPPYVPGKPVEEVARELGITNVCKLASNESVTGPSPLALEAIRSHLADVHRYPDDTSYYLTRSLAGKLRVRPEEILLGNGADEVLLLLGQMFLDPGDECVFAFPSFTVYRKATRVMAAVPVESPLKGFRIDVKDILRRITSRTKMVFLCNPNNPTGHLLPGDEIRYFLDNLPDHVFPVIDEAYKEFVSSPDFLDGVSLFREGRSLGAVRTFSKIYGLAGLRVGYAVVPEELSSLATSIRNSFNINRLAQHAALAALEDEKHVARTIALTAEGRRQLEEGLSKVGLKPIPSQTNFVCADSHRNAEEIHRQLLARGFIIRPLTAFALPTYIRITVGTIEENSRVLKELEEVLNNIPPEKPEVMG